MNNITNRVFIVDMENTNNFKFLTKYEITKKDEIILFLSDKSKSINPKDLQYILDNNLKIKSEYVSVGTKNAMDFQIVAYISLNIKSNKQYYIVSDDKGFTVAINYISEKTNKKIELISQDIEQSIPCETPNDTKNEIIDSILESIPCDEELKNKIKQFDLEDKSRLHNELVSNFGEKGREIYKLIKPKLTA